MNSGQPVLLDPRTHAARKESHRSRIEAILANTGLSRPARAFLTKALHPAGEGASPGIPDQNEVDLFRTELRATEVISPPAGLVPGTEWDCLIWCPPGDNTVAIVAKGIAGVDFRTAKAELTGAINAGYVEVTRFKFFDNVPGALFSGILTSNTTGTSSNAGPLWASAPERRFFATTYGKLMPKRWRTTASSTTVNLIANATANQGSVYCWEGGRGFNDGIALEQLNTPSIASGAAYQPGTAQFSSLGPTHEMIFHGNTGGPTMPPFDSLEVHEVVQTRTTSVPFHETDMFKQTPHLYATNAFHGYYAVHRLSGPDQQLQNTEDLPHTIVVPVAGKSAGQGEWSDDVTYAASRFLAESGETVYMQMPSPQVNCVPVNAVAGDLALTGFSWPTGLTCPPWLATAILYLDDPDTSFDNVTQSVAIFRGLSGEATLQLKRLISIEAAPLDDSPAQPFVTPPLQYEPKALALYYEMAHRMDGVLPAAANDFSDILNKIASVVKSMAGPTASVLSLVAPEFAPEIGLAASGATAAANLVERMTRKEKAAARKQLAMVPPRPLIRPKPRPQPKRKAVARRR